MKQLERAQFERLLRNSSVLRANAHGAKVLRMADGRIIKIFRPKSWLSLNPIYSQASRYAHAVDKLQRLGIRTVSDLEVYNVMQLNRHLVLYQPLAGEELRSSLHDPAHGLVLLHLLPRFFALLHQKGVYFRGLHFGNIVLSPGQHLGLIDVDSARFRRTSLSPGLRARNLRHALAYKEDRDALVAFGIQKFLELYLLSAQLSNSQQRAFLSKLERQDSIFENVTKFVAP